MSGEPNPTPPRPTPAPPATSGSASAAGPQPASPADALSPDEQMERFAQELKENDWGHQPC